MDHEIYLGNPNLKKANTLVEFDQEQIIEYVRCKNNPVYFAKNHVKIVTLDHGLMPFEPYDFQEGLINNFHNCHILFLLLPYSRQLGRMRWIIICYRIDNT